MVETGDELLARLNRPWMVSAMVSGLPPMESDARYVSAMPNRGSSGVPSKFVAARTDVHTLNSLVAMPIDFVRAIVTACAPSSWRKTR
jgi:hypothetical protein